MGYEVSVSVCILAFLFWAWFWDSPTDTLGHRLARAISRLPLSLGLGYSWQLFAPNPAKHNYDLFFVTVREDGGIFEYHFLGNEGRFLLGASRRLRKSQILRAIVNNPHGPLTNAVAEFYFRSLGKSAPIVKLSMELEITPIADHDNTHTTRRTLATLSASSPSREWEDGEE